MTLTFRFTSLPALHGFLARLNSAPEAMVVSHQITNPEWSVFELVVTMEEFRYA
jgi:hypothetical protein